MVIALIIHDYPFPNKFAFLPLLVILGIINWYLYERNFDAEKVKRQWEEESTEKRTRNGWLIGMYLMVSFLIPVVYGILKHNLKMM
jgi:uncharacterized membrane protein